MPEGLGDFVDALNNPKEFLSKEDKRLRQLQDKLGIDEKEISQVPSEKKLTNKVAATASNFAHSQTNAECSNGGGSGSGSGGSSAVAAKKASNNAAEQSKKSDEPQIDKLTREALQNMKGFQKLLKKQAKDNETLKKKQNKERALMQKQHSSIMDKMTSSLDKTTNGLINTNFVSTSSGPSSPKGNTEFTELNAVNTFI